MKVADIPKEVIKELSLEYQITEDGGTFERILYRTDRLLHMTVRNEYRMWAHLHIEDLQDIYQAACIGLHRAVLRIKSTDTPDQTILKVLAYARAEIRKEFPSRRNKFYTRVEGETDEPVYRALESEMLSEVFLSLIDRGVISRREYNMMVQRYINEVPWKTISQQAGMNIDSAKQMVYAARNRMRHQLRIRDITTEE